ncbi:hypothetical protein QBC41DRAFT_369271 [Cercophora samala]|uniref:Uncharacterized protein n=1 Tax=Cercophora samala TaxID=330535 RepID=A0AA39YKE5_9PEZI|nr:hypothetical protein QBC41DRAFT_369271 [Cercophora samala]
MPLEFNSTPGQGQPGHSPATPTIPSTGSSPFELPETPTPATGYPAVGMGTPVGNPSPVPAAPSSLPLPAPPLGSTSATSARPPTRGSPQVALGLLQQEQTALEARFDAAKDEWGYVNVPHSDIKRYVEVLKGLNTAQTSPAAAAAQSSAGPSSTAAAAAQSSAGPSSTAAAAAAASLDREMARIAQLEKILRAKKESLRQAEVEAKASLKNITDAVEEKERELVALRDREADLIKREAEVEEKEAALNEREELLRAGEDGLETQEEENMAYATQLLEREKTAAAILEKEKIIEADRETFRVWREQLAEREKTLESSEKTFTVVNELLVRRDMETAVKEEEIKKKQEEMKRREAELVKQEARVQQERQEYEKVKAHVLAVGNGQKIQQQELDKTKAALRRQMEVAYNSLPGQPQAQPTGPRQPPSRQPPSPHPAVQRIPQFVADADQRVVIGYSHGWEAALPLGVEQGRRAATITTTKMHIQHLQTVNSKLYEIVNSLDDMQSIKQIERALNDLQKEVHGLITDKCDYRDEVEISVEDLLDATIPKTGNKVWEYMRSMSIEAGCPVYYYFPASPENAPQPTAGILKPAPVGATPQSLGGVKPIIIVGNNHNLPAGYHLTIVRAANNSAPLPQPPTTTNPQSSSGNNTQQRTAPGTPPRSLPPVPTIVVTTPGGTNRPPTPSQAARKTRFRDRRPRQKPDPAALRLPRAGTTKRARSASQSPGPPAKRPRGRPPKNKEPEVTRTTTTTTTMMTEEETPVAVAAAVANTSSGVYTTTSSLAPAVAVAGVDSAAGSAAGGVVSSPVGAAAGVVSSPEEEDDEEEEDGEMVHLAAPSGWMELAE